MNRRTFLLALGAAPIVQAPVAWAQAQASMPVVGFLNSASEATYSFNAAAFRQGLRDAGYVEGQNVAIEYRWGDNDYSRLPTLAAELANRKVAVIAATGDIASARAAQAATTTIPIVFTVGSDPVPFGLVTSLSRPTGNATGITLFSSTLMAKRLEFLREVAPNARSIALLMNPDNLNYEVDVRAAQDAARGLDRQTILVPAKDPGAIDAAFDAIAQKRAGAVLVASDPMFLGRRDKLAALAARFALPVVAWTREFAVAGVLLSYGTSILWMYREAGIYAGRILKGAKPTELPVIQPTKFELVINLKTAKALGLKIPQPLLLRADEVIQ
jgi:putative ABC transport system substrate-binding protein